MQEGWKYLSRDCIEFCAIIWRLIMVHKRILVVGGYGNVGKIISTTLAKDNLVQVVAAGRDMHKAERLSQETNGKVTPFVFDLFDPEVDFEMVLDGVSQVVMCLDQPNVRFVEACFQRGIDYIDITANTAFFLLVEAMNTLAKENGSCAVLSVGLAPGLTNILAAHVATVLDEIKHLDIFVMLGMGDTHGEAAVQWMLENSNIEFSILEKGKEKRVRSFEDGKRTFFPGIGERTAYRFNFPDQHSLPRTQGITSVSTRFCFDIEVMTKAFATFKRIGVLQILKNERIKEIFIRSFERLHFGSDQFALKVEASGRKNHDEILACSIIRGVGEARMTGLVATQMARCLYMEDYPSGVFHIDQLFELQPLIENMIENGSIEITHALL
jgi:saccharopine dehydrogenase-like NADP-dependent oxidoreductase